MLRVKICGNPTIDDIALAAVPMGADAVGLIVGVRHRSEDAQEPASIPIAAMSEVPNIVSKLVGEGRRITRVTPAHRTLEEIYLDLVGEAR